MDRLNIVVPFYKPHPGWEDFFIESVRELEKELYEVSFSIILVNDGTTGEIDGLEKVLNSSQKIKYFALDTNRGKGFAIRYGISKEEADYYFYTDLDFPFGHEPIIRAYSLLKTSGMSLVIGIRQRAYFKMLPIERECISYMLKWFSSVITGFRLKDTQAPMKAMDNLARKVLLETTINSFMFDFEFLLNCWRKKIPFGEIPITPRERITFTDFKIKFLKKQFIDMIKVIFR
jgi:glycosyltransferase involved in cell wall biosynthesis